MLTHNPKYLMINEDPVFFGKDCLLLTEGPLFISEEDLKRINQLVSKNEALTALTDRLVDEIIPRLSKKITDELKKCTGIGLPVHLDVSSFICREYIYSEDETIYNAYAPIGITDPNEISYYLIDRIQERLKEK